MSSAGGVRPEFISLHTAFEAPDPVHIEIWPSGTMFAPGETLRLVIQGSDIYRYPEPLVYTRHAESVNVGAHVIYSGGEQDSYLLVPIVSPGG